MDFAWLVLAFLGSLMADLASSVMAASDSALEEASLMPRLMVASLGLGAGLAATTVQELALVIGLAMLFLATGGTGGIYFLLVALSALHLGTGLNNLRIGGAMGRRKKGSHGH